MGDGEAAFHMASLIAAKFSVVTTLARSITPIEHNLDEIWVYHALRARARRRTRRCCRLKIRIGARRLIEQEIECARSRRTARRRSCSAAPA